jgi:hypothetical protein
MRKGRGAAGGVPPLQGRPGRRAGRGLAVERGYRTSTGLSSGNLPSLSLCMIWLHPRSRVDNLCGYHWHFGLWLHWHICALTWEDRRDVFYGFQVSASASVTGIKRSHKAWSSGSKDQ